MTANVVETEIQASSLDARFKTKRNKNICKERWKIRNIRSSFDGMVISSVRQSLQNPTFKE